MKVCPNCGNEVPDKARLCAHCSTPLPETVEPPLAPPPPTPEMQAEAQLQAQVGQPLQPHPGTVAGQAVQAFPGQQVIVRKTEGKAVASLVCGILGIVVCPIILSIVAIVLSRQSSKAIKDSGGMLEGEGLATWGLVTGIIGLVLGIAQIILVIALFSSFPGAFTTTGF